MQTGITTYTHTQTVAAATWTITHGLGHHPVCDVNAYIGGVLTKIFPQSVTFVDANTLEVSFGVARTGEARLA